VSVEKAEAARKKARLAAALRENLKRRKAQARAKKNAQTAKAAPHREPAKPRE
jgi:hypothetical protein